MIKTPLSTVIGGAFWTPKATILGGTSRTLNQLIKSLFANNEQGFAYDPNDLSTMFQDAAGTVPVTGVGQPVGLTKDKSGLGNHASQTTSAARPVLRQKPILGSELLPTYDFRTWVAVGATSSITVNSFTTTSSGGVQIIFLKPNTKYWFELDLENTANIAVYHGSNVNTSFTAGSRRKVRFEALTDAGSVLYLRNATAGTTTLHSIKIQEITGYIADQYYIDFDAVDDKLITTLPAQLTGCTVVRAVPNFGTQILTNQTIPTTYNDNKDHCGLIVINRALTASETSQITKLFNRAAGV